MDADVVDSSSAASSSAPASPADHAHRRLPAKRRAGRKKFRETRHPVYRGVRARGGGGGTRCRWVCEVREPQAQARIWLGTYPTPEMAARAHDVAAIALRGGAAAAHLNFPDSAHALALPRARTAAPDDIRCAAAQAAELYRPSSTTAPAGDGNSTSTTAACCCCCCYGGFLDEDAIFDMHGLIHDMARGMLLTPPAMGREMLHLHWGDALDDDDDSHLLDYCTLWTVD